MKTIEILTLLSNKFLADAVQVLDGIPVDLKDSAMKECQGGDPSLVAFADDVGLTEAIKKYARSERMPSMNAGQRWCFAIRLRYAAGWLYPFIRQQKKVNSKFVTLFDGLDEQEAIETLLLDLPPILHSIISDYLRLSEIEWTAPFRSPWMPDKNSGA